jgi:hypothetical protein
MEKGIWILKILPTGNIIIDFLNLITKLHTVKIIFFMWDWGLKSELPTYKAGILPLKPHLQSVY